MVKRSISPACSRQGYEAWLGLQTAHDKTLNRINRGHNFSCYRQAVQQARRSTPLAPLWCESRWNGMQAVGGYLQQHGGQGSALDEKWRYRP